MTRKRSDASRPKRLTAAPLRTLAASVFAVRAIGDLHSQIADLRRESFGGRCPTHQLRDEVGERCAFENGAYTLRDRQLNLEAPRGITQDRRRRHPFDA